MGARLKVVLNQNITVLAAIFNGDPAGPGTGDPQERDRYGLNFRVNDPPLVIGEVQYVMDGNVARAVGNAAVLGVRTVLKF
jgi:porin